MNEAAATISLVAAGNKHLVLVSNYQRNLQDRFSYSNICTNECRLTNILKRKNRYPETHEMVACGFGDLIDSCVNVLGGCSGTTRWHIAPIQKRKRID